MSDNMAHDQASIPVKDNMNVDSVKMNDKNDTDNMSKDQSNKLDKDLNDSVNDKHDTDNMSKDQSNKLDKDLNDSVNDKHDTDGILNAPVTAQSRNPRKRRYPTKVRARPAASSMSTMNTPMEKKSEKEETTRRRKSWKPRRIIPTTSDLPSQTLDGNAMAGNLPIQGTVPQGELELELEQSLQSEADRAWWQFLENNLYF